MLVTMNGMHVLKASVLRDYCMHGAVHSSTISN